MTHEKNQDARWLKPLVSQNFVARTLITRIETLEIPLVKTFVFKQKRKIVLGINNLLVSQLSNFWQVGACRFPPLLIPVKQIVSPPFNEGGELYF